MYMHMTCTAHAARILQQKLDSGIQSTVAHEQLCAVWTAKAAHICRSQPQMESLSIICWSRFVTDHSRCSFAVTGNLRSLGLWCQRQSACLPLRPADTPPQHVCMCGVLQHSDHLFCNDIFLCVQERQARACAAEGS